MRRASNIEFAATQVLDPSQIAVVEESRVLDIQPAATIFTIGHSARTLAEFVALLAQVAVDLLVDVRSIPRSRTNPQFNADALPESLAAAGIGYRLLPALGGRRHRKKGAAPSTNMFWQVPAFRNYADYAMMDLFRVGLEELKTLARDHRCAIMCAEAVWWRCHRRIIADYLLAEGFAVEHIMGPGKIDPAKLTPGAQILPGGRLVYPAVESIAPGEKPTPMLKERIMKRFKVGDHVTWNSEAGHVSGTIIKVHTKDVNYKGHVHRCTTDDPQYEIKSSKTDHIAMHRGSVLKHASG